jgi:hypothetical protein
MNVNLRRLRELNFHELISVGVVDPCTYTFSDYEKAGYVHSGIAEYCVSCESKGCHVCPGDSGYRLTNISHGAHSTDYFTPNLLCLYMKVQAWTMTSTPTLHFTVKTSVPRSSGIGFTQNRSRDPFPMPSRGESMASTFLAPA